MKEKARKQMKKTQENGITLIALVITIIILLILATVTLNVVLGEGGLIDRAQQAKDLTEQAVLEEQQGINSLMSEFTNIMAEDQTPQKIPETTQEAKPNPDEDGPKFENTTTITDDLDNPVTIPGGFHLDKDSGTKVEEGIVIEDDNGNQFVWIPTGEYNVSTTINSTGKLTNELTRRTFTESGSTPVNGDDAIAGQYAEEWNEYYYGEGNENSVAKDQIDAFKTSATTNKGFYIGRYEQGEGNVCKAGVVPYVNVPRDTANNEAKAMYSGNEFVTSELISSYAWDTALNFICQTNSEGYTLATTTNRNYGNIGTNSPTKTGEYVADKYSNICDLLGNRYEWTTEYASYSNRPCVGRGGDYYLSVYYAANRYFYNTSYSDTNMSFRLQLYVNPES